jgi:hypothetical protein
VGREQLEAVAALVRSIRMRENVVAERHGTSPLPLGSLRDIGCGGRLRRRVGGGGGGVCVCRFDNFDICEYGLDGELHSRCPVSRHADGQSVFAEV